MQLRLCWDYEYSATSVDIIRSAQRQQESVTKADVRPLHYARVEQKKRRSLARGKDVETANEKQQLSAALYATVGICDSFTHELH